MPFENSNSWIAILTFLTLILWKHTKVSFQGFSWMGTLLHPSLLRFYGGMFDIAKGRSFWGQRRLHLSSRAPKISQISHKKYLWESRACMEFQSSFSFPFIEYFVFLTFIPKIVPNLFICKRTLSKYVFEMH